MSAKTAFYLLISFFPLLVFLLRAAQNSDVSFFEHILPPSVLEITRNAVGDVKIGRAASVFSSLLAIWSASSSVWALMRGIFTIHTGEHRIEFKKGRFRALLYIIFLAAAVFICVPLTFISGWIVEILSVYTPLTSSVALSAVRIFFIMVMIFVFSLSLYSATPCDKMRLRNLYAGSLFTAVGWVGVSWGFEIYIDKFSNYADLYGDAGMFLVLALWLFIISIIMYSGAELNMFIYGQKVNSVLKYSEK